MAGISGMAGDWGWWQEHKENLTPIGIHTLLQKKASSSDRIRWRCFYSILCFHLYLTVKPGGRGCVRRPAKGRGHQKPPLTFTVKGRSHFRSPLWHSYYNTDCSPWIPVWPEIRFSNFRFLIHMLRIPYRLLMYPFNFRVPKSILSSGCILQRITKCISHQNHTPSVRSVTRLETSDARPVRLPENGNYQINGCGGSVL